MAAQRDVERLKPPTAELLCAVHRSVRVAQQLLGSFAAVLADSHANAGGDEHLVPVDLERLEHSVDQALRDLGDRVVGVRPRTDQRELVPARARDEILLPYAGPQPRGDPAQKRVANGMAQSVVDHLETVKIERQHAHPILQAPRVPKLGLELGRQQRAIRQSGEGVLERAPTQLMFALSTVKRTSDHVRHRLQEAHILDRERAVLRMPVHHDHVARSGALRHRHAQTAMQAMLDNHRRNRETRLAQQVIAHHRLGNLQCVRGLRGLPRRDRGIERLALRRHQAHLSAGQATSSDTARRAENLAHHEHRLAHQHDHVAALKRATAEVGDHALLPLGAALLGHILKLREEVRLSDVRLDQRDRHDRLDNRPVRAHVTLDQRSVRAPVDHRLALLDAALPILGMREVQDRSAHQLVCASTKQRAQRLVDPQHAQLLGKDHHPDRGVVEPALKTLAQMTCAKPGRQPPDREPDKRNLRHSNRDRTPDTQASGQNERRSQSSPDRRDRN